MTTPISTLPNGQTIGMITPTAAASSTAGNDLTIGASNAVAGTSNAGAANGGAMVLNLGNAARNASGNGNGGGVTVNLGTPVGSGSYGTFYLPDSSGNRNATSPTLKIGTYGFYQDASGSFIFTVGGTDRFSWRAGDFGFNSAATLAWTSGFANASFDTSLSRSTASTLSLGNGTNGDFSGALRLANIQGNNAVKALTEGSATTFVTITVPSNSSASGKIQYAIEANDATDYQNRSGELYFSAVNKAGTTTIQLFRAQGSTTVDNTTDGVAVSAGTLTNTFTATDGGSGAVQIKANATSSLTQTTLQIRYRVEILNTNTITPA